jgi:hypothetical protein
MNIALPALVAPTAFYAGCANEQAGGKTRRESPATSALSSLPTGEKRAPGVPMNQQRVPPPTTDRRGARRRPLEEDFNLQVMVQPTWLGWNRRGRKRSW